MDFAQGYWTIKKIQTKKAPLPFDELRTLYTLDLSNNRRLDRVRDLCLIGAHSGLRHSDFTRIKPEHIIKEDGGEMIQIFTKKTDTEVVIPLVPQHKASLEKYDYQSPPSISDQKLNNHLKELFKLAGSDQDVSVRKSVAGRIEQRICKKWELAQSHMSRRSFATNYL